MSVDLGSLHKILRHPIRRRIVLTLREKKELTYVDLMNFVEVENTGKLNYHLKILGDLIEKNRNGRYSLTEKGQLASQLLLSFPEKAEHMRLGGGDAVLIGFAGFLVALANPWVWSIFLVGLFGIGVLYLGSVLSFVYALMVLGGVSWWLTIRRTSSHDLYNLFKPPLATFALLVVLLILVIVLNIRLTITVPIQDSAEVGIVLPSFLTFIFSGFFSFLGVAIFEIIHRVREKRKF